MKNLKFIIESSDYFSIEAIDWREIEFVQLDQQGNLTQLGVILPGENRPVDGLDLTIQVVMEALYQPHITIPERLRRKGLAAKIYRALIENLGHLYSGRGRRQNPMVERIWAKLMADPTLRCAENSIGTACWLPDDEMGPSLEQFLGEE